LTYLGFVTEGKLAAIFIKPSLGVSNWPVIYFIYYTPTSSLALFNTGHQGGRAREGVFSRRLAFARSLSLFTRAGARVTYLVRGIVLNGAYRILFAAYTTLTRLLKQPKYAYMWYIGGFLFTALF
jgi:hypothetical protein